MHGKKNKLTLPIPAQRHFNHLGPRQQRSSKNVARIVRHKHIVFPFIVRLDKVADWLLQIVRIYV